MIEILSPFYNFVLLFANLFFFCNYYYYSTPTNVTLISNFPFPRNNPTTYRNLPTFEDNTQTHTQPNAKPWKFGPALACLFASQKISLGLPPSRCLTDRAHYTLHQSCSQYCMACLPRYLTFSFYQGCSPQNPLHNIFKLMDDLGGRLSQMI